MKNINKPTVMPNGEVRDDLSDQELDRLFSSAKRIDKLPKVLQAKLRKPERPKAEFTKER